MGNHGEPWRVFTGDGFPPDVIRTSCRNSDEVEIIAKIEAHPPRFWGGMPGAEVNANRIVSCVNALEGLNPEAVKEALKYAVALMGQWDSVMEYIAITGEEPHGLKKLREAVANLKEE